MAKPLEEALYRKYIRNLDWKLEKGGIDYNLYDHEDHFLCSIKIMHAKGKREKFRQAVFVKQRNFAKKEG